MFDLKLKEFYVTYFVYCSVMKELNLNFERVHNSETIDVWNRLRVKLYASYVS
jgi:hypothetical protein